MFKVVRCHPEDVTDKEYDDWYKESSVVDGVRIGPVFNRKAKRSMKHKKLRLLILKEFDTQRNFAKELNTSTSLVSYVVNGERKLNEEEAIRWQHFLNCSYQDIYEVAA